MQSDIKMAEFIANLLDNKFNILGFRFGADVLLDMIPGLGDIGILVMSGYIVMVAMKYKVPQPIVSQMIFNITVSFILGLIPAVGEAAYLILRPNIKNYNLLKKHMATAPGTIEGEIVE
jgi:hypothetical protein